MTGMLHFRCILRFETCIKKEIIVFACSGTSIDEIPYFFPNIKMISRGWLRIHCCKLDWVYGITILSNQVSRCIDIYLCAWCVCARGQATGAPLALVLFGVRNACVAHALAIEFITLSKT